MDEAESYLRHGESVLTGSTSAPSLWSRKVLAETYWQWAQLAIARRQPDLSQVQTDKAIRQISEVLALEPSDEAARVAVARYRAGRPRLAGTTGASGDAASDSKEAPRVPELAEITAVLLPSVAELRLANRWDETELALEQIESRLVELRDVTPSLQLDQTLSDVYFDSENRPMGHDAD